VSLLSAYRVLHAAQARHQTLRGAGAPRRYTAALSRSFLQEARFWQTAERDSATLAGYYDVASASARNAFFHLHAAGAEGVAGGRNESAALVDHVHPNALGHAHLAYPVIFYLEQALRLTQPNPDPTLTEPELAGAGPAAGPARLPPPMFPGNHDFATFCRAGEALRALADAQQGWEWEPGDKAGFATHAGLPAGDLVLAFDLAGAPAGASAQLGLGVLVSNWSAMGAAHGRCSRCKRTSCGQARGMAVRASLLIACAHTQGRAFPEQGRSRHAKRPADRTGDTGIPTWALQCMGTA